MTTGSHIGKRLFVAQALPATNNAAGFEALTWVEVKGWQVLPQLGVSHAAIDVPDGASGFTQGLKGAGTGNDSTMTVRKIAADAGQADVRELADVGGQDASGSIKIVKATGTLDCWWRSGSRNRRCCPVCAGSFSIRISKFRAIRPRMKGSR